MATDDVEEEQNLLTQREFFVSIGISDARCVIDESPPEGNIEKNNGIGSCGDFRLNARVESIRDPRFFPDCFECFLSDICSHVLNVGCGAAVSLPARFKPKSIEVNVRYVELFTDSLRQCCLAAPWHADDADAHDDIILGIEKEIDIAMRHSLITLP